MQSEIVTSAPIAVERPAAQGTLDILRYALLLGVLIAFQQILAGQYQIHLADLILIQAIAALGVNVIMGFAGLISMAHAATLAVGAYTSALLMKKLGLPFGFTFPMAALYTGMISGLFGLLGARVKPSYFLLITLGVHQVIILIIVNEMWLTGGAAGLFGIPSPSLGPWTFDTDRQFFFLVAPIFVIALYAAQRLRQSRAGRAMVALRQNENASASSGIRVNHYRVAAMIFAGVYLGAAGSLTAHLVGYIGQDSFSLALTLQLTLVVVIGGIGSNIGSVVATAALELATEQLRTLEANSWLLLYGLLIIVVMIIAPKGLAGVAATMLRVTELSVTRFALRSSKWRLTSAAWRRFTRTKL